MGVGFGLVLQLECIITVNIVAKIHYFSTAQNNGKAFLFYVFRIIFKEKFFACTRFLKKKSARERFNYENLSEKGILLREA